MTHKIYSPKNCKQMKSNKNLILFLTRAPQTVKVIFKNMLMNFKTYYYKLRRNPLKLKRKNFDIHARTLQTKNGSIKNVESKDIT